MTGSPNTAAHRATSATSATSAKAVTGPGTADQLNRRREMYLMYEDLARAHMRQRQAEAARHRQVARVLAARRWQRRAEHASRRARHALALATLES